MINMNLKMDNFWQNKALDIFLSEIIAQSDFLEEGGDYVYLHELIQILEDRGWNPIFARNAVLNLIGTPHLNLFEDDLYWLEI